MSCPVGIPDKGNRNDRLIANPLILPKKEFSSRIDSGCVGGGARAFGHAD